MPAKRLSMRKTREILRLRYELGLGKRQIARNAHPAQFGHQDPRRARPPNRLSPRGARRRREKSATERPGARRRLRRCPIGLRSTRNCVATSMSPCSCCGRSKSGPTWRATSTAASASCTRAGRRSSTSSYARTTGAEKSCSSIMPELRCRSAIRGPGRCGPPTCLSPRSEQCQSPRLSWSRFILQILFWEERGPSSAGPVAGYASPPLRTLCQAPHST